MYLGPYNPTNVGIYIIAAIIFKVTPQLYDVSLLSKLIIIQ